MSNLDPLSQLRGLHLPEAVSPWPPAPGWWILLAFSVLVIVGIGYYIASYFDSRRYRRKALAEYSKIVSLKGDKERIRNSLELLRRTVISATGDTHYASLSLDEFLDFLQETCAKKNLFNCDRKRLEKALYSPLLSIKSDENRDLCDLIMTDSKRWILDHKVTQVKV